MGKMLIIEDDKRINEGVKFNLELDGFSVVSSFTLNGGREVFPKENIRK